MKTHHLLTHLLLLTPLSMPLERLADNISMHTMHVLALHEIEFYLELNCSVGGLHNFIRINSFQSMRFSKLPLCNSMIYLNISYKAWIVYDMLLFNLI